MDKLATPAQIVDDLRKNPEMRKRLDKRAIWGLLSMAEKQQKDVKAS